MTRCSIHRVCVLLLLTLFALSLASGCHTPPLLLNPQLRPASYVPEEKFAAIEIVSFANEAERTRRHFLNDPKIVFNDALFSSLSESEAFQSVSLRSTPSGARYRLSGWILTMDAESSFFSPGKIAGECAAHFRLEDTITGEILLDETISGSGAYRLDVRVHSGIYGIESAMSDAITRTVSAGTDRIIDALAIQIESGARESAAEETPEARPRGHEPDAPAAGFARRRPPRTDEVADVPVASISAEEAKTIIKRSIGEQTQGFQVENSVVTDFKLSFVPRGSVWSSPGEVIFFFETLGRMDITLRPKGYVIRVWDANRRFRFRVVIPEEEKAKRFMDAMRTLSLAAVGHFEPPAPPSEE